nr:YhdP family protein [Allopusillimonas soli]
MDVRAVLTLTGTENNRLTTDIQMAAPRWHPTENLTIDGDALHLYLDGPARGYAHLAQGHRVGKLAGPVSQVVEKQSGGSRVLNYRLIGQGVRIIDPHTFPQPIALQHIMGQGQVQREDNGQLRIAASQMFVANTDAQARLKGWWSQGGGSLAGLADITGTVDYARVAAIGDYLPEHVNKLAREWMSQALTQGVIKDAELTLRGNLRHFPFQEQPEMGDFRIAGAFSDTTIDYLPPHGNEKGWPAVEDMQGRALLHRADLRLDIDHAIMQPAPGQAVQVTRLAARIPDLEHDPILDISGETEGGATAYLGLMTHSPLGQLLGNVFEDTRASGDWQVPLALTIPLTHASDTQVDGAIHFQGNTLHLMPGVPAFEQMQGVLAFTQDGATAQGIKGTVLGGAMKMDGALGGQGKGLRMRGTLTAKALSSYAAIKAVDRLKGQAAYTAVLQRKTDAAAILTVRTDMRGLSADMPPPLGKAAAESLKVKAVWAPQRKGAGRLLAMQIGPDVDIRLLHREGAADQPFFQAGALGIYAHPDLPAKGLNIEARFTDVNLDEWNALRRELGQSSDGASGAAAKPPPGNAHAKPGTGQPFMPALARLRLQSDAAQFHGMALDQLTFTILQPEPGQWRADVSASTTAGTIRWQEHHGQLQGPIRADFNRLALGNAPEQLATHPAKTASHSADAPEQEKKSMPLDLDQGLDLPPISLRVQDLALYGRHVGALSLTARAESHGTRWRLDHILLSTPEAQLTGQGAWQLTGPQRGLSLKAAATVRDMGAYMDRIQYKDILSGGNGTLVGEFKWKNIPWSFKREDLSGTLDIALDKGRFSNLNSYSARLLELLSLQSVKRLARLNFSPGSLLREGFPFDTLRGTLVASDGVLSTHDYRVIGPAGTIVLEGDTNLVDETLNMQAVVVPDLDASGAAIAAGIAINPIVGIGAFLAQLFLQAPLSEAMTAQYHITGTWEEPKVEETTPPAKDRVPDKEPPP